MRRPPSTRQGLRVQSMNERESMQEAMEKEQQEMIRTINRANRALGRIFNLEEEDDE